MPDEEIYKITFDLDSGVASELNSLNNRLSQIQARTKVLDRGFKDKVEQSALVGAFAGGMQTERNKANTTVIENKILKRVVINKVQEQSKKAEAVSTKRYQEIRRQVFTGADDLRGALAYRNTPPQEIMKMRRATIQANQEAMAYKQRNTQLLAEIKLKDVKILKLNEAVSRKNITINMLAEQIGVLQSQVHGSKARSQMTWNRIMHGKPFPDLPTSYSGYEGPTGGTGGTTLLATIDTFISHKQKL